MITTRDVKTKEDGAVKLTMVTTNSVEVKQFQVKGKGSQKHDMTITTSNIDKLTRLKKREEIEAKKGVEPIKIDADLTVSEVVEKTMTEMGMDAANVQNADDEVGVPMTDDEEKVFLRQYAIVTDDEFDTYPMLRRYLK